MTCTSTGTASMPWNATVRTRETMPPLSGFGGHAAARNDPIRFPLTSGKHGFLDKARTRGEQTHAPAVTRLHRVAALEQTGCEAGPQRNRA
jgi:hypothetical protein